MENLPRVAVFGQPGSETHPGLLLTRGGSDHWRISWALNWGNLALAQRRGKWARGAGRGAAWSHGQSGVRDCLSPIRRPGQITDSEVLHPLGKNLSPALEGSCGLGWDSVKECLALLSVSLFISIYTHTLSPEWVTLLQISTPAFKDRQWAAIPGLPSENVSEVTRGARHWPSNLMKPYGELRVLLSAHGSFLFLQTSTCLCFDSKLFGGKVCDVGGRLRSVTWGRRLISLTCHTEVTVNPVTHLTGVLWAENVKCRKSTKMFLT